MRQCVQWVVVVVAAVLVLVSALPKWPPDSDGGAGRGQGRQPQRHRGFNRNYQHVYDPYPFDFRGFYWLRGCT